MHAATKFNLGILLLLLLNACVASDGRAIRAPSGGESSTDPDASTGTDLDGDADSDADTDSDADVDGDADTDANTVVCEEKPFDIARDAGRLMILMDLSDSMSNSNRWTEAQAAVTNVLTNPSFADIEFGFDVFPDNDCVAKTLQYDCAEDNASAITGSLPSYTPDGLTPLYCAMMNFLDPAYAPGCSAPGKAQYLLVVSDGQPSCSKKECISGNWDHPTAGDMGDLTSDLGGAGIKTFVIGFAYQDSPDFLNSIASNGGTGVNQYIEAGDNVELESALTQVAGSVVSCTFEIQAEDPSSDPEKVNFYFDNETNAIPRNDDCAQGSGEGWTWTDGNHTHIEICEQSCERLESGDVSTLRATFGCKTVVV